MNLKWLENFYRECGREVTLAYTTLNQMKNWAIVVAGAILSGLAFGSTAGTYPNKPMFVGVVIAFVFTLRFFIRAILCYINLVRWNTLQRETQAVMLWTNDLKESGQGDPRLGKLAQLIDDLYFEWYSPIPRALQISANLKLGFSLLFVLCLFFLLWGAFALASDGVVQGLLLFVTGSTAVELRDFFKSRFFDTKERYEKRKDKQAPVFPRPNIDATYLWSWVAVLLFSLLVSFRGNLIAWYQENIVAWVRLL